MSTAGAAPSGALPITRVDTDVAPQRDAVVYTCSRLGRRANPPGFSLSGWFRFGRNR